MLSKAGLFRRLSLGIRRPLHSRSGRADRAAWTHPCELTPLQGPPLRSAKRASCASSGYPLRMSHRSLESLSTVQPTIRAAFEALEDKKLYKFRSIATAQDKARLRDIMLAHRIRFSRLSELNDPLEGKLDLTLGDWTSPAYRGRFESWAIGLHRFRNGRSRRLFNAEVKAFTAADHESFVREIAEGNQRALEARWRVLSLSATPVHELLWSHYADGHRGVALVLNASQEHFGCALPVTYVGQLAAMDITDEDPEENFRNSLLTKKSAWSYEQEFRCVAAGKGDPFLPLWDQFLSFEPTALSGVIFGAKCSPEDQQLVMDWAGRRGMQLTFKNASISRDGAVSIQ